MNSMQPFKIVKGYLPEVDILPSEAKNFGLTHRCAFVIESYRPNCVDMFFDAALYEGLVNIVHKVVGSDKIRIQISKRETREVATAEEFHTLVEEMLSVTKSPFPCLFLLRNSSVVALIHSEPWALLGGPSVYHDSYTLAVFTQSDLSDRLTQDARAYAAEVEAELSGIVQFEPTPPKFSLLYEIKKMISRRYREG